MKEPEGELVFLAEMNPRYVGRIRCYRSKPREWWVYAHTRNWASIRCKTRREAINAIDTAVGYHKAACIEIITNTIKYKPWEDR